MIPQFYFNIGTGVIDVSICSVNHGIGHYGRQHSYHPTEIQLFGII